MIKVFYSHSVSSDIPKDISDYRLNKINSAKRNRQAMINSARILKSGFASYGINEADVIYALNEHGKPFSENFPNLKFSLSHAEEMAIIAFSDKEIGIDCEKNNKVVPSGVLKRFFSEAEQDAFKKNPLLLWVSKEALVKQVGSGFLHGYGDSEIPYYSDEATVNGRQLKRLSIDGFECVLCSECSDIIEITEI